MINVMSDNGKKGTNVMELVADTAADVSNLSQWGDKCAPGSTAKCVETGDEYMMKSDGTWNRQNATPGSSAVDSINGKTGVVTLTASDVDALPDDTPLFSGSYNDLTDKPTIPDAQIQSDWEQSDNTKKDYIKNKPTIPVITGKADKVDSATNGNFAGLDANGNLTDSGKKASDFLTATDLSAKVPDAPAEDGTYTLKVTVSSGTATYSWVSDT